MKTQTESKPVGKVSDAAIKAENPMQERHCGEVAESVVLTAEAAFMARRLEVHAEQGDALSPTKGRDVRGEAGPIFVP